MTRRPGASGFERQLARQQRMAPGGRMSSEAPTKYGFAVRPPLVGGSGGMPSPPTLLVQMFETGAMDPSVGGGATSDIDFTRFWSRAILFSWNTSIGMGADNGPEDLIAGDQAVMVIWTHENPDIVVPADWTVMASGYTGQMRWWIIRTVVSAETTWVIETGLADGWPAALSTGMSDALVIAWRGAGSLDVPQLTAIKTCASANAIDVTQPEAGWALPVQVVVAGAVAATTGVQAVPTPDPALFETVGASARQTSWLMGEGTRDRRGYYVWSTPNAGGESVQTWSSDQLKAGNWGREGESFDAISFAVGWLA